MSVINVKNSVRRFLNQFRPSTRMYEGRVLPAPRLRLCGKYFRDDRHFLESAKTEAERLIKDYELNSENVILDLGCGYGRLAFGILERLPDIKKYIGIDVNRDAINWCTKYINSKHQNFSFIHTDVANRRYNPDGSIDKESIILPVQDRSVNILYLYSVFSHMDIGDIESYLKEFQRILADGGKIFLTAFVEDGVEDMVENPAGYTRDRWQGPLHCVRYDRNYFESCLERLGFEILNFSHATESHGQSSYYLGRK